jgi:predicted aldo/keto reductase-like oxidoreductase
MKDMMYRAIGKTGMAAGVIGLGAEHLDGKPFQTVDEVIGAAMDHGVNMMDLFMPGEAVRSNIGRALKGKRDRMLIQGHICSTDVNEQYDQSRDGERASLYRLCEQRGVAITVMKTLGSGKLLSPTIGRWQSTGATVLPAAAARGAAPSPCRW